MDESKIKIIIVDNNNDFCNILSDYISLQKDMFVTGIAEDGIEALKLIKEKKPDLVVLNIIMPILNGIDIIEIFNKMDLNQIPRIIVLSTVGQDKTIKKALSLGVDYYFVKPLELDSFIKTIRQMFNSTIDDIIS